MSESHDPVTILNADECFDRLGTQSFGCVVVRRKDDMDLFPLNYVEIAPQEVSGRAFELGPEPDRY